MVSRQHQARDGLPAIGLVSPKTLTGPSARADLYWIPVGAGGHKLVSICARIYEVISAATQRREPKPLFHTALVITEGSNVKVIECAWPSPDDDLDSRGVVIVGPVFFRRLGRLRSFRYEVRCWENGIISDLAYAADRRQVSDDPDTIERLLAAVASVPSHRWGREVLGTGEMWNSNSVISHVLFIAGITVSRVEVPAGGRVPGWDTGVATAGFSRHGTNGRSLPANRP